MGKTNRLVFIAKYGAHANHTMVANRRTTKHIGGKKLQTTIIRCNTCFHTTGNDNVQVEQEEIRRDRL